MYTKQKRFCVSREKHCVKPACRLCTQSACRFSAILPRNPLPDTKSACGIFEQSAEKSSCASYAQALCSVAFISLFYSIFFLFPFRQPAARSAPPWTKGCCSLPVPAAERIERSSECSPHTRRSVSAADKPFSPIRPKACSDLLSGRDTIIKCRISYRSVLIRPA